MNPSHVGPLDSRLHSTHTSGKRKTPAYKLHLYIQPNYIRATHTQGVSPLIDMEISLIRN